MTEIERIIDKAFDVKKTIDVFLENNMPESAKEYQKGAGECKQAIEQYVIKAREKVRKDDYEQICELNAYHKQEIIKARIEELKKVFELSLNCATAEEFGQKVNEYCVRIEELESELKKGLSDDRD